MGWNGSTLSCAALASKSTLCRLERTPAAGAATDRYKKIRYDEAAIDRLGHVPLPPYITRTPDALDRERYQSLFARVPGAVAAPRRRASATLTSA